MQIHEDQEIIEMFDRCESMTSIAKATSMSTDRVKAVLVQHYGADPRAQRDARLADELVRQHLSGRSVAELARSTGINERTIHRRLAGRRPARKTMDPAVRERIEAMVADQVPQLEIADTLGVSAEQIARVSRGRGWSRSEAAKFRVWLSRNPQARTLLKWN